MPDLRFAVLDARAEPRAAAPQLAFRVRIVNAGEEPIHSVMLRCQIRIEPAQRRYAPEEQPPLKDLFGEPERWGQTLRGFLWAHANLMVPSFTKDIEADLPVPCTFDFNVATTKYFHALREGEVPLTMLFSGTVFYQGGDGLRVSQIPWDREAKFRLPAMVWKEMMDLYYPNLAWLCLRRDAFDRLLAYKTRHGLPTWEQVVEGLLPEEER